MLKRLGLFVLLLLVIGIPSVASAQEEAAGDGPVAYAILFFAPTCGHCHKVIDEDLPVFEEEFGAALQVLFVDVTTQGGNILFMETCDVLDRAGRCGGVPMMAVGETLLFGSAEIPNQLPGIVREGLESGGIGLPPVQMLRDAYASQIAETEAATEDGNTEDAGLATTADPSNSVFDRFGDDLIANIIATGILLALLASFLIVLSAWKVGLPEKLDQWAIWISAGVSMLVVLTLVAESADDSLAQMISWGVLALLGLATMLVVASYPRQLVVPVVALAGLAVAIYLARIETAEIEATCGVIGNCNAVQQSEYAQLFGVLPVGVLGAVGYVGILGAWALTQIKGLDATLKQYAWVALLGMTLIGAAFSIYLTFLEPFVIGATCAWCLTSAMTMLLLLWLVAPEGWDAFYEVTDTPAPATNEA